MDVMGTVARRRGTTAADRVLGEPAARNGATVVPVATVRGGAG